MEHLCRVSPDTVEWAWSSFSCIPVEHLYAALGLRQSIFIVEQSVPYHDVDGKDLHSMHLFGFIDRELVAYLRALPKDLFEQGVCSFGRVVVRSSWRGSGLGRELVRRGIEYLDEVNSGVPIKISSQLYLRDFYATFRFAPVGGPYIEDLIPHIAMIRR